MGYVPYTVKIMRFLKNRGEVSLDEILGNFGDGKIIRNSIKMMVDRGVLLKEEDMIKQGEHFNKVHEGMEKSYKPFEEVKNKELVMRGSLIVMFYHYEKFLGKLNIIQGRPALPLNLVYRVLPFEKNEVEEFLKKESEKGCIKIIKLLGRHSPPSQIFLRFPHVIDRDIEIVEGLSPEEIENIKKYWRVRLGPYPSFEEDFISGFYTKRLEYETREFLSSRNHLSEEIRDKLDLELNRLTHGFK